MKKIIFVVVALAASISANAQLLWKVSGNGVKGESYLFGTHHLCPVSILDSVKGFDQAIAGVDAIYGEMDMSKMADPEVQQTIIAHAIAPADSLLTDLFSKEQLDSLGNVLGKYSGGMLTVEQVNQLKPAMINTQIASLKSMAFFPEFAMQEQLDSEIQNRGRELGKRIGYFETLDFQLSMLLDYPISEQVDDLLECVRTDDEAMEKVKDLSAAYISRDIDRITEVVFSDSSEIDEKARKRIIDDRNSKWIEDLKDRMPEESILVAVGAAHLIGENGLIEQLKKAGYTVEPVDK